LRRWFVRLFALFFARCYDPHPFVDAHISILSSKRSTSSFIQIDQISSHSLKALSMPRWWERERGEHCAHLTKQFFVVGGKLRSTLVCKLAYTPVWLLLFHGNSFFKLSCAPTEFVFIDTPPSLLSVRLEFLDAFFGSLAHVLHFSHTFGRNVIASPYIRACVLVEL
jgi:hypothetical protein